MEDDVQFNFADGGLDFCFPVSAQPCQQQESRNFQAQVRKRKRRQGAGATATAAASSPAAERLQRQHKKLSAIEKDHKRHLYLLVSQQEKQKPEDDSEEENGLSRVSYLSSCVSARKQELQQQQQLLHRVTTAKGIGTAKKKKRMEYQGMQQRVVFDHEQTAALNSNDTTTPPQLRTATAKNTKRGNGSFPSTACEPAGRVNNRCGEDLERQNRLHQDHEADGPKPHTGFELPRRGSKGRRKRAKQKNHKEGVSEDGEGVWEDERPRGRGWASDTEQRQQERQTVRCKTKGGRSILIRRVFDVDGNLTKKKTKMRSKQKNMRKDNRPQVSIRDS